MARGRGQIVDTSYAPGTTLHLENESPALTQAAQDAKRATEATQLAMVKAQQPIAAPSQAAPPPPPPSDPFGGAGDLARQMTARRLMLLRQGLQGQQRGNIAALRRQLAQRGALDSGSLGAGVTDIGNNISDLLARGTQEASISENGTLLDFLKAKQERDFAKEAQQAGFANNEYMARLMQQFQKENEPKWWETLLGTVGNVAGTAAGVYTGRKLAG